MLLTPRVSFLGHLVIAVHMLMRAGPSSPAAYQGQHLTPTQIDQSTNRWHAGQLLSYPPACVDVRVRVNITRGRVSVGYIHNTLLS